MVRKRRSCLTVPGDDPGKLAKAAGLDPDELILDLEDAVAADRKDEARDSWPGRCASTTGVPARSPSA